MEKYSQISGGIHGPFVYRDDAGKIHVGDDDNDREFDSVWAALSYAKQARLSGGDLSKARAHYDSDARDNYAAEYSWHVDAGLQIDALNELDA